MFLTSKPGGFHLLSEDGNSAPEMESSVILKLIFIHIPDLAAFPAHGYLFAEVDDLADVAFAAINDLLDFMLACYVVDLVARQVIPLRQDITLGTCKPRKLQFPDFSPLCVARFV